MSVIQMYESLLEHYWHTGEDYEYTIFNGRILFTDIRIRLHHKSSNINITMMDLLIYEGDYRKAPDLSPVNMLRQLHKLHSQYFTKHKGKELYKLHVKGLKAYKDGYDLIGFRKLQDADANTHTFREHLLTYTDKNSLTAYKMVVNMVNNKLGGNIQSHKIVLDDEGKIIGHEHNETNLLIYTVDVMDGLTHGQISDLFIKLDEGKDTIIMSRLVPHIRKRTIDDFLSTLDDDPPRPI